MTFVLLAQAGGANAASLPRVVLHPDLTVADTFRSCSVQFVNGDTVSLQAVIRRRGNSSKTYDKPSYALKLVDSTGVKMDYSFLGMRSDNYWILDAMAADKARLRNRAAMDLWLEIAPPLWYADQEPEALNGYRGQMVDVWVDTTRMGIYCLMERLDRKQLKLKKYNEQKGIRGVFYKATQWTNSVQFRTYTTTYPSDTMAWDGWEVGYPDLEDGEPITWQPLMDLENFILNRRSSIFRDSIAEHVDLRTFENYVLLCQLLSARDNGGKNTYWSWYDIQKSPKATPSLWDMDHSWGRMYTGAEELPNYDVFKNHWLHKRLGWYYPGYTDSLKTRYAELRKTSFSLNHLDSLVGRYFDLYHETGMDTVENLLWTGHNGYTLDLQSERPYIHHWLQRRLHYLDSIYGYQPFRFPHEAICNCQLVDSVNRLVTIIFNPDTIPMLSDDSLRLSTFSDSIQTVSLYGPMTDLNYRQPNYYLDQRTEDGCYYHTYRYDEVHRPGNSGQPEFTFIIDMKDDSSYYYIWPDTVGANAIDRRLMIYNGFNAVMLSLPRDELPYLTTDRDELYRRSLVAREIRPVADYNLNDSVDQHRISNFRLCPGTTCLYRSYHPYYPSTSQYDTEVERLHWVGELGAQAGIRSDICLTGNMEGAVGQYYMCGEDSFEVVMPQYQRALIDRGDILYVGNQVGGLSVAGCYYHTADQQFAQWFRQMVEFVNDTVHPAPFQIHCAIGADRTGMFCALLELLCGADWMTVQADYMETGNMKIQTYRHPNRLRYGLQLLTGLNPDSVTSAQLSAAIRQHFVGMGVLTNEQIDQTVARLTYRQPVTPTSINGVGALDGEEAPCYDLLGRHVPADTKGILIQGGRKKLK